MNEYVAPQYELKAFTCPHCGAYAGMAWNNLMVTGRYIPGAIATCRACGQVSHWRLDVDHMGGQISEFIWPRIVAAPPAHMDLPAEMKADVEEARRIAMDSPRGAAALLRLVVEKLAKYLKADGDNINAMIGDLVAKGLPERIQRALDSVRVIGNNAVHAGKMDQADVAATVNILFSLVNMIVEDQITQNKQLDALFEALPEGAKNGIEKRDAPKLAGPKRAAPKPA